MNSKIAKIIVAIYLLLYGGVNLLIVLAFNGSNQPVVALLINLTIVVLALTLLFVADQQIEKVVFILLLAAFGTNIFLRFFTTIPTSAIYSFSFGAYIIPIGFSIIYFLNLNKEKNQVEKTPASSLETRLNELEKFYSNGLITSEEYLEKRKKIIELI